MTPVPSIEMDNWKQGKTAKATPAKTKAATTKKPAAKDKKPAAKENQAPAKKTTTKRKPAADKKSAVPAVNNIDKHFPVSKGNKALLSAKAKVLDSATAKAEPLAPSSKSNSRSPPEKTGIKVSLKRKQAITAS